MDTVTTYRLLLLLALVVILPTRERLTFYEANFLCEHMGVDPVYEDDADYNAELRWSLQTYGFIGDFWLSGNDIIRESLWVWADFDNHISDYEFQIWAPDQPIDSDTMNCLYIHYDGFSTMWYNADCHSRKHALCMD
ncbi:hypothetical protein ScPMuIL_011736 [Solemya velum]